MSSIGHKLEVSLGKTKDGQDFSIDFERDSLGLTLLLGCTGTGKSVLHYHIYRQLMEHNTPKEIAFVFIDNTMVDFYHFPKGSPYLYCPVSRADHAILILDGLANRIDEINQGQKHIFVHIEECDLFAIDSERMQKVLSQLLAHRANSKIHIVFSTSRPSPDVLTPWLLELTDLKVIFQLASATDYITATGKNFTQDLLNSAIGEKLVLFKDKVYHLLPLTPAEAVEPKIFSSPIPIVNVGKVIKSKRTPFKTWLVVFGVVFIIALIAIIFSAQI